ncbi:sensor histidine kinase [Reichenbachiella agarivorans]|uniref:histidine kinase n=1 Tax=Reichenbachiella agarivorans TaxID=2979464 RepID=A0ABY6CN71_9BACT|nr:sensor histidine kinase [Reichenbachiella agarivorans]UXP31834.1 sensor histidine kinase [Reichenbachiella agarivorans]
MRSTKTLRGLGYSGIASLIAIVATILIGQYYLLSGLSENQSIGQKIVFLSVLLILIIAIVFATMYPQFRKIYLSYTELIRSEDNAKTMASQVSKLYDELGKSYQDLEAVNHIPEEMSILMKADMNGRISHLSEKVKEILFIDKESFHSNFFDWLKEESYREDFIVQLKDMITQQQSWNGEIKVANSEGDFVWLDLVIQPVPTSVLKNEYALLIIGRDISDINEARQRSREINHELVDKRVKEQQYRSVLILEGQEEERKRIAQEIHDGIGQMLTGLKLSLEGIIPSSSPHMRQRLSDSKHLMKSIIKEVRRVSFNLAPSSLVDYGIVPALKKIGQETTALTETIVTFENKTGFINRLDSNIETNLYRIVQEAVNNGIKYAKAKQINITLSHTINQLQIQVKDNGKGFDIKKLEKVGHFGASGHGIFNMKERAAYVNAAFEIETNIGQGTTVTIKLPLT